MNSKIESHAQNALDLLLDAPSQIADQPEAFVIDDEKKANWLVRKIMEHREYRDRVKKWAEAEVHRSQSDEERLIYFFGNQLQVWATHEIEKLKGRRRSISLPAGTIGFRKIGPKLVIEDDETVLTWARKCCPSAIIVSERLVKTPIHKHIENTGEIPQGMHLDPGGDRFEIR